MYYIELENCPTSENNRMYVNEVDKMNYDNNVFDVYVIAIHGDGEVREYDFPSESERYDYIGCTIWYHVDHCI